MRWDKTNEASASNVRKEKEFQSESHKKESQAKGQIEKKDIATKEAEKQSNLVSLENEISKLKVSIAFTELVKNEKYKFHIAKMLKVDKMLDTMNVADDEPSILSGQAFKGSLEDSEIPPFYLSLICRDFILHKAMLDSGASHNLMPKFIMEKLGLSITRPYHDLYSFDSGRVKCLGLIKDVVVSLDQISAKNVLMDVVVADIPPRFGVPLSRSWGEKIKGTLHVDFSYATILVFGQLKKLYREKKMKFMINSKEKPINHSIHDVHTNLDSFIMFSDMNSVDDESYLVEILEVPRVIRNMKNVITTEGKDMDERCLQLENHLKEIAEIVQKTKCLETTIHPPKDQTIQPSEILFPGEENGLWTMEFDGAVGREGARIGVWIHGPLHQS